MTDSPHTHPPDRSLRARPACLAAFLACACLLLPGCTDLIRRSSELKPPDVELAQVALEKADLLAPVFRLKLRVENPNDQDIQVEGADAQLDLEGERVAEGVSANPVQLKAQQQSEVEIQATAKTLSLARQVLRLDQKGRLAYAVTGHLALARWLGILGKVPFRVSGTLTREELFREIEGLTGHRF